MAGCGKAPDRPGKDTGADTSAPAAGLRGAPPGTRPGTAARIGQLTVRLETVPAPPRSKRETLFRVRLSHPSGDPAMGARVGISLFMPGMHHGENLVPLTATAPGVYEGRGILVMAGRWAAEVRVRHPGGRGARSIFFRVPH